MKIPLMEPRAHKSLSRVDAGGRRMARLQMSCENSRVGAKEPQCRRLSRSPVGWIADLEDLMEMLHMQDSGRSKISAIWKLQ